MDSFQWRVRGEGGCRYLSVTCLKVHLKKKSLVLYPEHCQGHEFCSENLVKWVVNLVKVGHEFCFLKAVGTLGKILYLFSTFTNY